MNLDFAVDLLFAMGLVAGSTSAGYLILRMGWPKVRILGQEYKSGWSLILGVVFSVLVVAISFLSSALGILPMAVRQALFVSLIFSSLLAAVLLTVRRKFIAGQRIIVSIPKKVLGTRIVAGKAMEKIEADRGFMRVERLEREKIESMRSALGREKARERPGIGPAAARRPEARGAMAKTTAAAAVQKEWAQDAAEKTTAKTIPAVLQGEAAPEPAAKKKIVVVPQQKPEEIKKEEYGAATAAGAGLEAEGTAARAEENAKETVQEPKAGKAQFWEKLQAEPKEKAVEPSGTRAEGKGERVERLKRELIEKLRKAEEGDGENE